MISMVFEMVSRLTWDEEMRIMIALSDPAIRVCEKKTA